MVEGGLYSIFNYYFGAANEPPLQPPFNCWPKYDNAMREVEKEGRGEKRGLPHLTCSADLDRKFKLRY